MQNTIFCLLLSVSNGLLTSPTLQRIEDLMNEAEYASALLIIKKNSEQLSSNGHTEKMHWLSAHCHISLGNYDSAVESFIRLLRQDPLFKPRQNVSPKILTTFAQAREKFKRMNEGSRLLKPKIQFNLNGSEITKATISLNYTKEITAESIKILFFYRKGGSLSYSSKWFSHDSGATYSLVNPFIDVKFNGLENVWEYFYIGYHRDEELFRNGTSTTPLFFLPAPKAQERRLNFPNKVAHKKNSTGFWIGTGAVVVLSLTILTIFLTQPKYGTVTLSLSPPSLP